MFGRPKGGQSTRHLFVGNCGPGVGLDRAAISQIFSEFGPATIVVPEQQHNPRSAFIFVTYTAIAHATAALEALNQKVCAAAGDRLLTIKYADLKKDKDCPVAGLSLAPNFVSEQEEQALLACAEEGDWETLARRRVCHFGYKFEYKIRNVNPQNPGKKFPAAMQPILEQLHQHPDMPEVDQCTVNEYPVGVGLSPHIDTHSAFTGAIASLSLAGHAVMEFRREGQAFALLLPPRSLLVMAGPARYCWQHYIPHRKADWVNGCLLPRASPRVSFTFRKVRGYPCDCEWPEQCDSQQGSLPPTRMASKGSAPPPLHSSSLSHQAAVSQPQTQFQSQPQSQPQSQSQPLSQSQSWVSQSSACYHQASGLDEASQHSVPQNSTWALSLLQGLNHEQHPDCSSQQQVQTRSKPAVQETYDRQGSDSSQQRLQEQSRPQQSRDVAEANSTGPAFVHASGGAREQTEPSSSHAATQANLQRLEQEFVHDVYNAIAPHFSATRFAVWPKVRLFIDGLHAGAVVADVGCGNGKYFLVRPDIAVLGSDRSSGLATVADARLQAGIGSASGKSFKADVAVADGMQLPYASQRFDAVLCIAVLHHITSPARRIEMLTELLRLLRPGGKALVTVWATDQEDMKKIAKWQPIPEPGGPSQPDKGSASDAQSSLNVTGAAPACEATATASNDSNSQEDSNSRQASTAAAVDSIGQEVAADGLGQVKQAGNDYFVPWHLPFHRAEAAMQVLKAGPTGSGAPAGSIRVDNKKGAVVFSRYYHVFEQFELDQLVQQVPDAEVLESFYDKDNWCVVMGRRL